MASVFGDFGDLGFGICGRGMNEEIIGRLLCGLRIFFDLGHFNGLDLMEEV